MNSQKNTLSPLIRGFLVLLILFSFLTGVRREMMEEYNREDIIKEEILSTMTLNIHDEIDVDFIRSLEGTKCEAYVPKIKGQPAGKSGVTIASGFDLGQRNEQDLRLLGLPPYLVSKFRPYLGLKKWSAINFLLKNPLSITQEECDKINEIIYTSKVRGIIQEVGEDTWNKLGRSLRTVLTSVQFQYGSARQRTPNFFRKVMSLDVPSVIRHLENFGDAYSTRRRKEANYLRMSLNNTLKQKQV